MVKRPDHRSLRVALVACACAASLAAAGRAQGAGNLKHLTIINTAASGGRACNGAQLSTTWTNTTGQTLYIKKAQVWQTLSVPGRLADVNGFITRSPGGPAIISFALDSYANPNNTTSIMQNDFAPDYFVVLPNEQLIALYSCVPLGPPDFNYYSMFNVWYTAGAP